MAPGQVSATGSLAQARTQHEAGRSVSEARSNQGESPAMGWRESWSSSPAGLPSAKSSHRRNTRSKGAILPLVVRPDVPAGLPKREELRRLLDGVGEPSQNADRETVIVQTGLKIGTTDYLPRGPPTPMARFHAA